jgi:hypothetical protein
VRVGRGLVVALFVEAGAAVEPAGDAAEVRDALLSFCAKAPPPLQLPSASHSISGSGQAATETRTARRGAARSVSWAVAFTEDTDADLSLVRAVWRGRDSLESSRAPLYVDGILLQVAATTNHYYSLIQAPEFRPDTRATIHA